MNLPNKLTIFRIILIPIFIILTVMPEVGGSVVWLGASIAVTKIWGALVFAIASITDFLDGQIARRQHLVTNFGKFADPIADKLLINTIFLLLASDQTINIIIPIIMISRDTIVDAIKMSAASKQVVVAASKLGKLKTVSQMIALGFLLVNNFPFTVLGVDVANALAWLATVISVISGIDYFLKNREMLTETM